MGNFKIEIEAVGGHGLARNVKQGEIIPYGTDSETHSPDVRAKLFVDEFAQAGNSIVSAKLVHWPDSTPIIDNLLTSIREHGDFVTPGYGFDEEKMLRFFAFGHLPGGPLRETSRLFNHLAHMIVRTVPSSAERTVALRKLLEAKDAAVRAVL